MEGKKSSYSVFGVKVSRNNLIIVSVLTIGIVILAVFFFSGFFQEILQPFQNPVPPVSERTGYAQVNLYNAYNESIIPNGTIDIKLFDYYNETNSSTVKNGEVFYVSNLTIGFAQIEGFNNETFYIFANPTIDDPHVNTIDMLYLPNYSEVQWNLVSINGTYGSYNSSDIPTGYVELGFDINFNGTSLGNSSLGSTTGAYYIPQPLRQPIQDSFNITTGSIWLGFNGSISNVSLFQFDQEVYSSSGYNFTQIEARVTGTSTFPLLVLNVNVTSPVDGLVVFLGQIDDYTSPIIIL